MTLIPQDHYIAKKGIERHYTIEELEDDTAFAEE